MSHYIFSGLVQCFRKNYWLNFTQFSSSWENQSFLHIRHKSKSGCAGFKDLWVPDGKYLCCDLNQLRFYNCQKTACLFRLYFLWFDAVVLVIWGWLFALCCEDTTSHAGIKNVREKKKSVWDPGWNDLFSTTKSSSMVTRLCEG